LSRRGQRDSPGGALKQADAKGMLQQLDLPAQRWLGHEQAGGRPAEMKLFGNDDKTAELE
jgi:hypothetical protein